MAIDVHPFLLALLAATNALDPNLVGSCFAPAYRNETPAHPGRNFLGTDQVRDNWRRIFTFVPDVEARVLRWVADGSQVWSEWEMSGTRLDGSRHLMRGVVIFVVEDGLATFARFYLEPVDETSPTNVADAVRHQVHADTSS